MTEYLAEFKPSREDASKVQLNVTSVPETEASFLIEENPLNTVEKIKSQISGNRRWAFLVSSPGFLAIGDGLRRVIYYNNDNYMESLGGVVEIVAGIFESSTVVAIAENMNAPLHKAKNALVERIRQSFNAEIVSIQTPSDPPSTPSAQNISPSIS